MTRNNCDVCGACLADGVCYFDRCPAVEARRAAAMVERDKMLAAYQRRVDIAKANRKAETRAMKQERAQRDKARGRPSGIAAASHGVSGFENADEYLRFGDIDAFDTTLVNHK